MLAIEVHQLSKKYSKRIGISGIDLNIREGEIYGLIGPDGAGKTTILRILMNYIFPSDGEATIFGADVVKESKTIKKDMLYVPSDIYFYNHMKASKYIKMVLKTHHLKKTAQVKEVIRAFEVDTKERFEDMDKGDRKKLALAAAIASEPRVLLLDEPLRGLDALMKENLFDYLKELQSKGCTILITDRDADQLMPICDKIAIIENGEITVDDRAFALECTTFNKNELSQTQDILNFEGYEENNTEDSNNSVIGEELESIRVSLEKTAEIPVPSEEAAVDIDAADINDTTNEKAIKENDITAAEEENENENGNEIEIISTENSESEAEQESTTEKQLQEKDSTQESENITRKDNDEKISINHKNDIYSNLSDDVHSEKIPEKISTEHIFPKKPAIRFVPNDDSSSTKQINLRQTGFNRRTFETIGATVVEESDNKVVLEYSGDLNLLARVLNDQNLIDISINHEDLKTPLASYFQGGDNK